MDFSRGFSIFGISEIYITDEWTILTEGKMAQLATAITGISIILAFFDIIAWGTVGWIVLGCMGMITVVAFANNSNRSD